MRQIDIELHLSPPSGYWDKIDSEVSRLTLSIPNIRSTFLIWSCTPFLLLPSEQPQFVRAWTLQEHSTGMLANVDSNASHSQVAWMSLEWWTILDIHRKLLSVKNPAVLQFLTQTGVPGTYYYTSFKGT